MQVTSSSMNYQYGSSADSAQKREDSSLSAKTAASSQKLSTEEQTLIAELSSTDTKVRAHEAAHIAAGGGIVNGGASFSYAKGPDGKMYATGGEVPIDTSEGKTPRETIQKARQIVAAAMAPADPSPQDYKVAATATVMEMRAHMEEMKTLQEKSNGQEAYSQNGLSFEESIKKSQSMEASPMIR